MSTEPDIGIRVDSTPTRREKLWIFYASVVKGLDFFSMVKHRDFVARVDNHAIGFLRIKCFRTFLEAGNLYVRKDRRDSRAARRLWQTAKDSYPGARIYAISRGRLYPALQRIGFKRASGEIPRTLKLRYFLSRPIGKILRFNYDLLVCDTEAGPS